MKTLLGLIILLNLKSYSQDLIKYVNPFIGTGGHGHTYPGATLPFGFVQLSPDTRPDGYNDWDGCSGYHYSDSIIYGFSHTHLSGTGIADYCDILLMPTIGAPQLNNIINNDTKLGYASRFSHQTERASPGFYSVVLEDDKIPVELTATARVGFHKYQFPATDKANIILDLTHRDKLLEGCYIEIISPTKIQGLRRSSSWAKDQWLYFAMEFSQPFIYAEIIDSAINAKIFSTKFQSTIISGTQLKSIFQFNTKGDPVLVKCALSPVSCAGAWKNMQAEIPHWDFEKVKTEAKEIWNKELSKIEITSAVDEGKSLNDTSNKLVIFYTALYHCMLAPNIYEDVDGKYRGRDNKIHVADSFDYYTVFSLWDTYRALHPLLTIIDQKRTNDFINTFLKQYEQGGRLPVWELSSNETDCMIGYHAVSVIADAAVKGIRGYDMNLAYEAMKHSANLDHFGLKYYKEKGFIESNEEPESVSKTLEYSYDDWCIAQMNYLVNGVMRAKNKITDIAIAPDSIKDKLRILETDLEAFETRSSSFLNLMWNGFMRPRFNGGRYQPFDPYEVNFNYTEANAWQYSFSFPHQKHLFWSIPDVENNLDSLFIVSPNTTGRNQSDITGLIGQYAHGNEPSHHIPYLFNLNRKEYKTQFYVNKIINDFYTNSPRGLIGNEDCGQMSAWYVFSSMGIYPLCPAKIEYELTTPAFDEIVIHLENGNAFNIKKYAMSDSDIYIQNIIIDDTISHQESFLTHDVIMNGQFIEFFTNTQSDSPNKFYGYNKSDEDFPASPIISATSTSFSDSLLITISKPDLPDLIVKEIRYGIKYADEPMINNTYQEPFYITKTATITSHLQTSHSIYGRFQYRKTAKAHFIKLPHNYKIKYLTTYDRQYTAGGDNALIDGLHGNSDFRTGMWQGWPGENMEVVLDLGEIKEIKKAGAGFLQDVRSWIWMPAKLEIYSSDDGINFTLITTLNNTTETNNYESKITKNVSAEFVPLKTRYLKFVAVSFGKVPDWHPGKGGESWIFCDEVWVE